MGEKVDAVFAEADRMHAGDQPQSLGVRHHSRWSFSFDRGRPLNKTVSEWRTHGTLMLWNWSGYGGAG